MNLYQAFSDLMDLNDLRLIFSEMPIVILLNCDTKMYDLTQINIMSKILTFSNEIRTKFLKCRLSRQKKKDSSYNWQRYTYLLLVIRYRCYNLFRFAIVCVQSTHITPRSAPLFLLYILTCNLITGWARLMMNVSHRSSRVCAVCINTCKEIPV